MKLLYISCENKEYVQNIQFKQEYAFAELLKTKAAIIDIFVDLYQ